jgi:hypothetical protein
MITAMDQSRTCCSICKLDVRDIVFKFAGLDGSVVLTFVNLHSGTKRTLLSNQMLFGTDDT